MIEHTGNYSDPTWEDFHKTASQGDAEPSGEIPQAELREMFIDSTYVGRFDFSGDVKQASLDILGGVRERYGAENVVASLISIDPDTGQLGTEQGKMGIWVNTAAKNEIDRG